jgi:DNA invertase Pin-like site-specific DNA recombinase
MNAEIITPTVVVIPPTKTKEAELNRILSIAVYVRVSTNSDDQENSFEAQASHFSRLVSENPNWKLYKIYQDDGITGTQVTKRTGFLSMIKACRAGKVDIVIAKSISRFARNTVDSLNYARELKSLGIPIIFDKEKLNTMDDTKSEMMFTLFACFAQAESESISQNVTWGKREAFRQGKVSLNYKYLLGYQKGEDGKPEIVTEEAETIRYIFKRFLDGLSQRQISAELIGKGFKTKQGDLNWNSNTVKRILENDTLTGDVIRQKTYTVDCITHKVKKNCGDLPMYLIKNHHVGIIGREIFDKVQSEIARRNSKTVISKKHKTQNGKYSAKYALTELIRCAECGTPYRRVTWTLKGEKQIVWRCINRLESGKRYCKKSPTINEEQLHKTIVDSMNNFFKIKGEVAEILKTNLNNVLNGNDDTAITNAELQIITLKDETKKLVEQCAAGIDITTHTSKFKQLSDDISALRDFITTEKSRQKSNNQSDESTKEILMLLEENQHTLIEYDDVLTRHLVEQVLVRSDKTLEITFKGGVSVTGTVE